MVAVWAEPVALRDDHEGGPEAGGVVARITAVTQQDPLRVVPVAWLKNLHIYSVIVRYIVMRSRPDCGQDI